MPKASEEIVEFIKALPEEEKPQVKPDDEELNEQKDDSKEEIKETNWNIKNKSKTELTIDQDNMTKQLEKSPLNVDKIEVVFPPVNQVIEQVNDKLTSETVKANDCKDEFDDIKMLTPKKEVISEITQLPTTSNILKEIDFKKDSKGRHISPNIVEISHKIK